MTKKAKLYGNEVDVVNINIALPPEVVSEFELKNYIEVSKMRSDNKEIIVEFEDDDLLALKFSDDTEWIGHPEDIQEIYDKNTLEKRSGVDEDYFFDNQISAVGGTSRGIIKQAVIRVFSIFKSKKKDIAPIAMRALGKKYDKKVQPTPGLFSIDSSFRRIPFEETQTEKPYLLLIHGTLSSVISAFSNLNDNDSWEKLTETYGSNIMAFDHYTLSESPLKNALDFLNACPANCKLDIMSHSRGGLVADILAKCDYNNDEGHKVGFSANELSIFETKDKASHKLMLELNKIALKKRIVVNKIVRVAAPSSGTTILSRRVDHFFNLILNTISIAFGIQNPLYGIVKSFLMELISQKDNPESLPGLNSMVPDSLFQKMLNAGDTSVKSELYNIAGDAEVGGISFNSLKVILANLFYRTANDLVVDTERMMHGVKRLNGMHNFTSQDSETNHFNYFKNANSCEAILEVLAPSKEKTLSLYDTQVQTEGNRGILLDALSLEGVSFKADTISRDVVIIIPGIMGSTLAVDGEDQWIQMRALSKGAIVNKLNSSAKNVEASGVVKKFYKKFGDRLASKYDVISLEFDWRRSVSEAANTLKETLEFVASKNVNVHVVAHSMGGLVARQCMMDHGATWKQFMQGKQNKFIMLGTPWLGSYLIMEVLTGHSRRVKQLAMIDFKHGKKDLLKIFWKYPGVFELLPIEEVTNRKFWETDFWNDLNELVDLGNMPSPNTNKKSLNAFKDYRENVLTFLKSVEKDKEFFKKIYYICGKADKTVFDYTAKNRFFSSKKKLVYKATSEGDGSVTWKTGIPKQLENSQNLYYTNTTHGELANEPSIFEGVMEILEQGKTNKLSTDRPSNRSGEVITEVHEYATPLSNSNGVVTALFDTDKPTEKKADAIHVKVINGDLKVSSYPVMVGHFFMDLILSAEKALDDYLDGRLSQRLDIGYYPGKVGESEIFFNLNTQPKGAIICGLGTTDTLTPFLLSKTVKLATLKYAMFMRDNYTLPKAKRYATGISFILIGIGYGKLPIEDSLKGILLGVSAANEYLKNNGATKGLQPIKEIEIINYYESIASQAYFSLSRMQDNDNRISIRLDKGVIRRAGAKKKQEFTDNAYTWWYNLHITSLENQSGFKYYASKGLARIEQEFIGIGFDDIKHLLQMQANTHAWKRNLSKTLFEMLIPNDFKNVFRNQGNLILKLDKKSAEIPWELLHDSQTDITPIAVSSTFIRQLVTSYADNYSNVSLNNDKILVVGDPIYNERNLPPLPAAKVEAEWVIDQFNTNNYKTTSLINREASEIMMEFYSRQYKIMHFAGHGLYDPENNKVGIAIGNGICIDPQKIKQLGYVPEFVFINCCYSGAMNAADDRYTRDRYLLAANVGTQLIEMGVKAIIISGWAVDDAAAKEFSEAFYRNMFLGYDFGSSVQKARMACYQKHDHTNTWGAYQCYGNQFYKFNNRKRSKQRDLEYVMPSQVHTDMDNLLIAIRDRKHNKNRTLELLNKYLDKAKRANLLDAFILEKEALIYNELNEREIALQKFKELFKYANGNFSIEALEQYCLIKTHSLKPENIEEALREIEFIRLIGENPSRLNIIANSYKFASLIVTPKKEKVAYLKKAFECYEQSYLASTDPYDGDCLDAVTNMIFIGHILEKLNGEKLIDRLKKSAAFKDVMDVELYLTELYGDLEDFDKSNLDVSVLIGMAETKYGLMLLKSDFKPNLELDIIKVFKYIFQLLYSPRYIYIEQRQIDFLLHYIEDPILVTQLLQIRDEIQKMMKY